MSCVYFLIVFFPFFLDTAALQCVLNEEIDSESERERERVKDPTEP